jgi:DNA-binding response OmpR family regulator
MSQIIIVESEETARTALKKGLAKAGLSDQCRVLSVDDAREAAEGAVYIRIGAGEDDRFAKPVRLGAVLDRVGAHRRAAALREAGEPVAIGPYCLHPQESMLVHEGSGAALRLTDKEVHILEFLAQQGGRTVERRVLLDEVWGYAEQVETHTLETHIYRLRQKIEADPSQPAILLTEENGYKIVC